MTACNIINQKLPFYISLVYVIWPFLHSENFLRFDVFSAYISFWLILNWSYLRFAYRNLVTLFIEFRYQLVISPNPENSKIDQLINQNHMKILNHKTLTFALLSILYLLT